MAREIQLTQGKVAIVDDEDFDFISQFRWHAYRSSQVEERWYAARTVCHPDGSRQHQAMHRLILKAVGGEEVDHANTDGLDNRRCNIRKCSRAQNQINVRTKGGAFGYRGVERVKSGKFRAAVWVDRKRHLLGLFATPDEAARAYDRLAAQLHGAFARLNFPLDRAA